MSTITRSQVRHAAIETDAAKVARVEAVAREWQRLVRWKVHQLRAPEAIGLAARPRSVVKAFRASPERAEFSTLNSHLCQEAITHACAIVAGGWEQAAGKVRSRIARRRAAGRTSDTEAHELNWLLRWPAHLGEIMAGEVVIPEDARFAANDHAALDVWLRAGLRRARPEQPWPRHSLWYAADAMTYRATLREGEHFPSWISLPSLERGHPVRIPLAGAGISHLAEGKTLRVSVERDAKGRKRIVLRYAITTEVAARTGGVVAGADKGITTVLTVTESDAEYATSHGTTYGPTLTVIADAIRRPNRGRLWAAAKSADEKTARRLRKHNLGNAKRDRRRRSAEARLRQLHNLAIKEALRAHPEVSTLAVEDLGFIQTTDRGSAANRRLARWAKGQLQVDLERLSEAHGVRLQVVNAAYSSQACPVCSWTERANRKGPAFRCRRCGTAGSSDAVAASNLRSRASDPEITRFTPFAAVKQVLLRRAAARAEALGLPTEDHGAAPGMTTARHGIESPVPNAA
jgi:putative transposase